jgi:hypothetical protein
MDFLVVDLDAPARQNISPCVVPDIADNSDKDQASCYAL